MYQQSISQLYNVMKQSIEDSFHIHKIMTVERSLPDELADVWQLKSIL